MKRCPQCNRVETDDTLIYCRADGTTLINESGSVGADAGTVKFSSASVKCESETSVLPQSITGAAISRPTAPTTVLPTPLAPANTRGLNKPERRKAIEAIAAVLTVAFIAGVYLYWSRAEKLNISRTG